VTIYKDDRVLRRVGERMIKSHTEAGLAETCGEKKLSTTKSTELVNTCICDVVRLCCSCTMCIARYCCSTSVSL